MVHTQCTYTVGVVVACRTGSQALVVVESLWGGTGSAFERVN